jgi:rhodanese-related sulfurtransferase
LPRSTIDELLARARRRLDRVTVGAVLDAVRDGALIVDIRSEVQRASGELIPGAIFHPRNVLEWRCDPSSGYDDPRLSSDLDRRIVLVCQEGYQSSLAAAALQDLGFARATDLVGGFNAWAAAGLPVLRRAAATGHDESSLVSLVRPDAKSPSTTESPPGRPSARHARRGRPSTLPSA